MKKNKVNDLYSQMKTRAFVLHLVRAFTPNTKLNKILQTANPNMNCCICNKKLVSLEELYKSSIQGEEKDETNLAYTGDNTKVYICLHCFNQLENFIQEKVRVNDKQVSFALKKELNKDCPEMLDFIEKSQEEQKRKYEESKKSTEKVSLNSLGNLLGDEIKKKLGIK